MEKFVNAGSEFNLRNQFLRAFCETDGDVNIGDIDLILKHITFESKYKTQDEIPNMLAQLIATHKRRRIPFKKYLGAFNEYEIGVIETAKIDIDSIELDWGHLTPSALLPEQMRAIISKIDIDDVVIKYYDSEFSAINSMLHNIEKGKPIARIAVPEKEIRANAIEINKMLHNLGIVEIDRPLFFASVLLTLTDTPFYRTYEDKNVEDIRRDMINISAREISNIEKSNPERQNTKDDWSIQLNAITLTIKGKPRGDIIAIIEKIKGIYDKTQGLTVNFDVLGKCYSIFLTYGKQEKRGDITLTPEHIKFLMCRLTDVRYTDTILDTCTGSGGFLVKAMHLMEQNLYANKDKLKDDIESLRQKIKANQLLGIENEPKMYALACTNMKLNGDGRSNIIYGNGLKHDSAQLYFSGKRPTIGLINPPYSQNKAIKFLYILCKQIKNGGKVAIIAPNNFLDTAKKQDNRNLLAENTLRSVIKCNKQTFMNGVDTSIFVLECGRGHKFESDDVYYYNFENDGYEVVTRNGRIQTGDTGTIIENLIRDFNDRTSETKGAYSKKISNGYIGYHSSTDNPMTLLDPNLTKEDFEESIFDYFVFDNGLGGRIKEISNRDIKMFIIKETKNG